MIRKSPRFRRKGRREMSANQPSQPSDTIPTPAVPVTPALTVTFDQPVTLGQGGTSLLPGWTIAHAGPTTRTVSSLVVNSPTSVTLTFSGAISAADVLTIPNNDPAIRTYQGGYVQSGSYVLPT